MSNKKKPGRRGDATRRSPNSRRPAARLIVRRATSGDHWIFEYPKCVRDRADDLDEVHDIIAAGELEIAEDELRWLLDGCNEFLEAHLLLGKLTLEINQDVALARAHFGCAFQIGERAMRVARAEGPLPFRQLANRPFFEAGDALAECLHALGKTDMAIDVLEKLIAWDPTDPLHLKSKIDEFRVGDLPLVDL